MKKTEHRRGLRRFTAIMAAMLLTIIPSVTALADGDFSGNITIKKVVSGYEYKAYEVLDCVAAGGESSVYAGTSEWQDFLDTNENAIAMLTPTEYDSEMISEGCKAYTVNMESDKTVRKDFAADALQYARENGIEPTQSITAQDGDNEVTFLYLPLGIHVVDTAGRARVVVMWDMEWESEITESYKPEDNAADAGTGAAGSSAEAGNAGTGASDNSGETAGAGTGETEKDMLQQASGMIEESGAGENGADAENTEVESLEASVDTPSHAEEAASKGSSTPVILVVAVVVIVAVAAGVLFLRKKK